jgi:ribose-phosphate pyrophosphokinase
MKLGQEQSGMFLTTEYVAKSNVASRRGRLLIASCSSGKYLAEEVMERYRELAIDAGSREDIQYLGNIDTRFSDSDTCVRLKSHVGGADVFLFQALYNPTSDLAVDQNYMAFLIAVRAFKEHGASHVTGIIPYLAYARQDKPTKFMREPTTARLMADLTIASGIDRLVVWDPHCSQIRGFYGAIPVNMLESLTLFLHEFSHFQGRENVIVVAPDTGASKFITHFGRALNLKSAIASKYRPRPEEVEISEIIGDFTGKRIAIILDDMISSAGTIWALVKKLVIEKEIEEVYLGASHNLCVGHAYERLLDLHQNYRLKQVFITNSIPQTSRFKKLSFVSIRSLADPLARTINRIHYDYSVSDVFYRPA